jgi:hypothetical protein
VRAFSTLVLVVGALALVGAALRTDAGVAATRVGECTIAAPPSQATVEARMAYAVDFCELLSKALASEVFHAAVIVIPERLWHYPDAGLSCRLRFGSTGFLTVRNSIATCRWLARHAAGWRFEAQTDIGRAALPNEGGSNA